MNYNMKSNAGSRTMVNAEKKFENDGHDAQFVAASGTIFLENNEHSTLKTSSVDVASTSSSAFQCVIAWIEYRRSAGGGTEQKRRRDGIGERKERRREGQGRRAAEVWDIECDFHHRISAEYSHNKFKIEEKRSYVSLYKAIMRFFRETV